MRHYRVVFRDGQYAVHEVFSSDDGRIIGCTQEPVFPRAGTLDALADEIRRYEGALSEPVLDTAQLESEAERKRQTTG